jgi:hypothetical protein
MDSSDRMKITLESKYIFRHFDSVEACNYYANNSIRKVEYFCCGGRGIAITNDCYEANICKVKSTMKGTCDICFQEDVTLVKPCHVCVNTLCGSCLQHLPRKICPYCRSEL